jgi:tetratricopeptide (TPR) repeat protein
MKKMLLFVVAMLMAHSASAVTPNFCGDLKNAFGPFDYRKRASNPAQLDIVERVHFTPEVENGIKGASGSIGDDLSYTLRAWPNHHRALSAMATIALRTKAFQLRGAKYPVECWFDRAIRFTGDDAAVHAIYANYLAQVGNSKLAFEQLKIAAALAPDSAPILYNLGLAYLQVKDYDNAVLYAKQAYAMDFPLPGLKNKLIAAGKWEATPE